MKQFTIELRVDYDTPEKEEVVKKAVAKAARELQSAATLISDRRQPQVAVYGTDWFAEGEEIDLLYGDGEDDDGAS